MTCVLCQQNRPVARHLVAYDLDVCMPCFHAGAGSIHPDHEARFEELMRSKGIPLPVRNGQGLYPIGDSRAVVVKPFQSSPILAARRGY